jgi:hypothetical protein
VKRVHLQVNLADGTTGFYDGEYVMSNSGVMIYRVDGDSVYTPGVGAKLIGFLNSNSAKTINGQNLFTLEE